MLLYQNIPVKQFEICYLFSIYSYLITATVIVRTTIRSKFDSTDVPQPKKDTDSPEKYKKIMTGLKNIVCGASNTFRKFVNHF